VAAPAVYFTSPAGRLSGKLYPMAGHAGQLHPNPSLNAGSFTQQEILHDEFAFAPLKRAATSTAGYFRRLRAGFDFDDLIERVTVRTIKELSACSHDTPHISSYRVMLTILAPTAEQ
jgi:hypothetical protein